MLSRKPNLKVPPRNPPNYADIGPLSLASVTPVASPGIDRSVKPHLFKSLSSPNSDNEDKNKPYRPSRSLQSQIDKLSDSAPNLATCNTETRTEYFDLLPSFQMFQSIVTRNDFEFDEGNLGVPPTYDPISPSVSSEPQSGREVDTLLQSVSQSLNSASIGVDNDEEMECERQYLISDNESENGIQGFRNFQSRLMSPGTSSDSAQIQLNRSNGRITHESFGHSVLDNIDMLPHAKDSPLSIEIFVTKGVPAPNEPYESETKLKEYSTGDIVNGFVIITNTLDHDVDFGLFIVTLEATIKAVLPRGDDKSDSARTILQKKPLKMYDLHASYNEAPIPSAAGIEYKFLSRDESDGCLIGLPNDRILKGKQKYKKFIVFRFPNMLLDNACPHGVLRHTMPPPSFGLDETAFFKRAASIEVNKALGYGFLNVRGSPIKVKDYAFSDLSVSYTIEAKFIDKLNTKNQSLAFSPNDINAPDNELKYVISRSAQFFLRYVPDVKSQVDYHNKAYSISGQDTFDTIGINGMFYTSLAKRETWQFIEHMNLTIEQEIESALDKREFSGDDIKRKNLRIHRRADKEFGSKINLSQVDSISDILTPERLQRYDKNMILFTQDAVSIFGKKKKRILPQSYRIGEMVLCVKVPDKLIPYGSPKLIQKYNDGKRNANTLSSVREDTQVLKLYNRGDETLIKNLDIELLFRATNDNERPPSISQIEFNVVAWSYRTEFPINISFGHDFFYSKSTIAGAVIQQDDVENTKQNLFQLKNVINHFISFLKDTKTYISLNTYSYLIGVSKMGFKKDTIKNYFQNLNASTTDLNKDDWKGEKTSAKSTTWSRNLSVPLKIVNKNNVTLPPSFQNCLVGRLYALQVCVKFKGGEDSQNTLKIDVPVLVG